MISREAAIASTYSPDVTFITQDSVDFSFSSSADPTNLSIYQIDTTYNQPEYFLLKKTVKAVAGTIKTQEFTFSSPQKFSTIELPDDNVIEVLDIQDSDGNKWFEVPYLAQNTIYTEVQNNELNDPTLSQYSDSTPYLLKLKKVSRRFVTRFGADDRMRIEFGSGVLTTPDEEIVPNSDNIGMGLVDSISKMTTAFDPSNFLYTSEYGLAPANTTLTVRYLVGGGVESNVPSNTVVNIQNLSVTPVAINPNLLATPLLNTIIQSVSFNNPEASSGGGSGDTVQDLRLKTIANFPTQMRSVTKNDHIIRALTMPPKFGTIAKAYLTKEALLNTTDQMVDFVSNNPLELSMYVLSYDSEKKLTAPNKAVKQNLKNYLDGFKITTDSLNIKDAYYINIGINFEIVVLPSYNNREVLAQCIEVFKEYFDIDKWQINQPIIISELYGLLGCKKGIQNIKNIEIVNKYGEAEGYSPYGYDIKGATKDGVIYPSIDPSVFEVRYPDIDIYGRVVTI